MALPTGIRGRFFATLITVAMEFYLRHQDTIGEVLDYAVTEALKVVADNLLIIRSSLNPPGPQ